MHRALSTENLAYFAQSTLHSIRRIMGASHEDGDLAALTKLMEERALSGYPMDMAKSSTWVALLQSEMHAIAHPLAARQLQQQQQQKGGSPSTNGNAASPSSLAHPPPHHKDPLSVGDSPTERDSSTSNVAVVGRASSHARTESGTVPSSLGRPPLGSDRAQSIGGASSSSNANGSGSKEGSQQAQQQQRRKPASESQLLAALECLRVFYGVYTTDAVGLFIEHGLFPTMLDLLKTNNSTRKLNEAIANTLVLFMAERISVFSELADAISDLVVSAPIDTISAFSLVPTMRCLIVVQNALKRADLVDVEHSNGTKSQLVETGMLSNLLNLAERMRGVVEGPKEDENPLIAFALGLICMGLLGGLSRSNVPHKEELRKDPLTFSLWSFYASNVGRMECTFAYTVDGSDVHGGGDGSAMPSLVSSPTTTGSNGFRRGNAAASFEQQQQQQQGTANNNNTNNNNGHNQRLVEKQQGLVLDAPSIWAGELVEFITEVCTSDSFALSRQSLYAVSQDDAASGHHHRSAAAAAAIGGPATSSVSKRAVGGVSAMKNTAASVDPFQGVHKWEVLPMNWDAMVSDSVFIWRMVSAASVCNLSVESTRQLLEAIGDLDMDVPFADFVFRATISNLIILFRASPMNCTAIVEADAFKKVIAMMTVDVSVLHFEDCPKPRTAVKLGQQNWPACMALLTVITHTCPRRSELCTLMNAVSDMATNNTSAEDCEIIEHLLQVLASSTYPPRTLWFSASSATAVCPVDKFAGRWYGYTFLAWVNPLCIWQGGSHLFSWSDVSGPSSVVVSIVANGRKKCLSVCHTAGQDSSVSLLTESTFQDGWSHIAIVHNISGFTVFVNGQRKSNGNVPFPKEPSKPHRLKFHFGGSDGELGVKPFFGLMTQPQLMDGAVADKEIERLAAAGPGSNATSVDPPLSIPPLLTIDEAITGPLALNDCAEVRDVFVHKTASVADILVEEDVLDWFMSSILNASQYSNRNSVAILCLEMLIAYARLVPNGLAHIHEKGVVLALSKEVLRWDTVPFHLPPVVIGLVQPSAESRRLVNHPITVQVLTFLADIVAQPNCPPLTRNQVFRDLSSLLGDEQNIKLFRDGPGLMGILSVCSDLPRECTDDCVILIEKLIRDVSEMDAVLKFLVFEPRLQLMKCDILRMIYEVGQSDTSLLDALVAANAVPMLIYIVGDVATHQSENLRAYAIRLLALLLVMSRRQREVFGRLGGFDTFTAAMHQRRAIIMPLMQSAAVVAPSYPLRLTTFNFLFKFALGFFQPMEFSKDLVNRQQSAVATATNPSSSAANNQRTLLQQYPAMNGHLPSLIPQRDVNRRQISMDLASLHSDPDARLTIDDTYNSQSHSNKTELLHVALLQTIFGLLPFAVDTTTSVPHSSNSLLRKSTRDNLAANNNTSVPSFTANNNSNSNSAPAVVAAGGAAAAQGGPTPPSPASPASNRPSSGDNNFGGGPATPRQNNASHANTNGSGGSGAGAPHSTTHHNVPNNNNSTTTIHNSNGNGGNPYAAHVMGQSVDAISDCGSGSTSARRDDTQFATILKVLAFADRVFDISKNADSVVQHPWMEWLWSGVAPFLEGSISIPPHLQQNVEMYTRSIIRKICLADLVKSRSNSQLRRVKDLTEMPTMQRMVLEECLRYFSINNRLDVLQQEEATNVLRNMDTLLLGIEESISPFPLHLGMEVATALAAITVHNNAWVRTRVKNNTKLLETRDRLSFMIISNGWREFKRAPADRLTKALQANAHDPNATVMVLRYMCDAVVDRDVESVETLQNMLQQLHMMDAEQKRILTRVIADEEVVAILLTPPPPTMTSTSDHPQDRTFIQWCISNEARWDQTSAKILKAAKGLDETVKSQSERSQREFTAKLKSRKQEIERRATQVTKATAEYERLCVDVEGKRGSYADAVEKAHSRRREREEKRQSMATRTNSTHSLGGEPNSRNSSNTSKAVSAM